MKIVNGTIRHAVPSQPVGLLLCLFLLLLGSACSGQLFQVAPRPISPAADLTATATNNLEASAFAFTDDDRAFNQFGANLPLAGLLAVDLKLLNRSASTIIAKSLRFELRDASGNRYKAVEAKKALKRLMKFYGIRLYVIEARRVTLANLETLALSQSTPLATQEERRGLLFFEIKRDAAELKGLTLTISSKDASLPAPVTLSLN